MTKILMVCLGNICRSPLAEGILKSKLPKERFTVESAGTAGYHIGSAPDIRSIAIAKTYGLNISNLTGRQFTKEDFNTFDVIYVMDQSNLNNVLALTENKNDASKVKLILDTVYPNQNLDVPDPYYGGDNGFKKVFLMLEEACIIIAKSLL